MQSLWRLCQAMSGGCHSTLRPKNRWCSQVHLLYEMCFCMPNGGKKHRSSDELPGYSRSEKGMCHKKRKRVVSLNRNKRREARVCFQILASYFTNYPLSVGYSSTAAWAAANGNWFSALYGKFGKHLGNIMSMYCTFCTRFPQNIRPFLPLRLLFDILIVKHYC